MSSRKGSPARAQGTEKEPTVQRQQEQKRQPEREAKERGQAREPEAGQGDPVARFKQAQKEFVRVAGMADFDPKAKVRSAELREEMKQASQAIARGPGTHARGRTRRHRPPDQGLRPPGRTRKRAREGQGNREKTKAGAIELLLSSCIDAIVFTHIHRVANGTQHPE